MARHVLTPEEQLKGLRAAIASPRTPQHLRSALRNRMEDLQARIDRQRGKRRLSRTKRKNASLLDWLGL